MANLFCRRKKIIGLAFLASVGITLLVLGCALKQYSNWWPMFVVIFYLLAPFPTLLSRRYAESVESSSSLIEACTFLTAGIIVSAYGLPIILAHSGGQAAPGVITWGACGFVLAGNTVVFLTILGYFHVFSNDDFDYSAW